MQRNHLTPATFLLLLPSINTNKRSKKMPKKEFRRRTHNVTAKVQSLAKNRQATIWLTVALVDSSSISLFLEKWPLMLSFLAVRHDPKEKKECVEEKKAKGKIERTYISPKRRSRFRRILGIQSGRSPCLGLNPTDITFKGVVVSLVHILTYHDARNT